MSRNFLKMKNRKDKMNRDSFTKVLVRKRTGGEIKREGVGAKRIKANLYGAKDKHYKLLQSPFILINFLLFLSHSQVLSFLFLPQLISLHLSLFPQLSLYISPISLSSLSLFFPPVDLFERFQVLHTLSISLLSYNIFLYANIFLIHNIPTGFIC